MRTILWIILGMVIMYVLLRVLSKKGIVDSNTNTQLKKLLDTPQVGLLIKTNEFRELVKTRQFKDFLISLADDQIQAISQSLV